MKKIWLCLLSVACGGAPPRATSSTVDPALGSTLDRLVAAASRRDEAALAEMLSPALVHGGLWFEDATCRDRFAASTAVTPADRADFARCLATLPLARSSRTSMTPGVGVLTYEPGIEIEVAFDADRVRWIGFAGRRGADDALPTISADALEQLRAGSPRGVAEAVESSSVTWLKICLDETGAVAGVHPRAAASPDALSKAVDAAKRWTFRPFVLGGQPAAVCAMAALDPDGADVDAAALPVSVPDSFSDAVLVPSALLARNRVAGTTTIVPVDEDRDAIAKLPDRRVEGELQICIGRDGEIGALALVRSTGFPRYDEQLAAALAGWRFAPILFDGSPAPVCTLQTIVFKVR